MTVTSWLAAVAVLLCFAAVWELAGTRGEEIGAAIGRMLERVQRWPPLTEAIGALGVGTARRLRRAGLEHRVRAEAVIVGKAAGMLLGGVAALGAAPAAPGRTSLLVALALPAGGFVAPDALLERAARRRHARLLAALPDALDLMAAGAAAGRPPVAALAAVADGTATPLADEVSMCMAEISCGVPAGDALERLRDRAGGAELATLAATLARSGRYGSPLADQLRTQATAVRLDQRRVVEERAARAAPKIQLVVALVLVPSVLLLIVAALLANSGAITGGL